MVIRPVFEKVQTLYHEASTQGLLKNLSPSLKLVTDLVHSILTYIENRPKSPKKAKVSHFDRGTGNNNHDLHDIVDNLIS